VPVSASHPARAVVTTIDVRAADLGEPSPLPRFTPLRPLPPADPGEGVPAEIRARAAQGRLTSPLPYRVQDGYDRRPRPTTLPAIALDNGVLRAVVLPGLGGRVWSLTDRARDRELLFVNPVLQPANFGLTDAWYAGGIEWNLGSTGHAATSSRPVHAGVVRGPDGDLLRLWEWERTRDLVLQIDLSLPEASDRLFASTRVINPDPEDKPLYWWTTIATPETERTRVLVDAATAWRSYAGGRLAEVALPHPDGPQVDVSVPWASRLAADYFYDVRDAEGRHVVAVEPDGRGFAQSSTRALRGRKLFLWGHGPGGRRWQEWLCGPGARYLEIQAGRCPTQLEHDVIPGGGEVSWTEAFGGVDLDPAQVAGPYAEASAHARSAVHAAVPPDALESRHRAWRERTADAAVDDVLAVGSGWGEVEHRLRESEPVPALPFPVVDDDSAPVRSLLAGDRPGFEQTADRLPVPPVSDRWRERIATAGDHWWLDHARAVHHQLRGEPVAARAAYSRSVSALPTAPALRGLGLLAAQAGALDEAVARYDEARALDPSSRTLVTEELDLLLDAGRAEDALAVVATLAGAVREHGRTRLQEARARAAAAEPAAAEALLADAVVEDLAEGETAVSDLWLQLHPGSPVPAALDFRMTEPNTVMIEDDRIGS
jgi:hypothetical protein